jgi:hypothetical protein
MLHAVKESQKLCSKNRTLRGAVNLFGMVCRWNRTQRRSQQPKQRSAGPHYTPNHVPRMHTPGAEDCRRGGRAIFWDGNSIRRAAMALRETYGTDFYVMARKALEAAIRDEGDPFALLDDARRRQPPKPASAAAVVHAA